MVLKSDLIVGQFVRLLLKWPIKRFKRRLEQVVPHL